MVSGKVNPYSAVVLSMNAEVYKIDKTKFAHKFANVIPDLKEFVKIRNDFLVHRLKKQARFHFMMNYINNKNPYK